MQVCATEFSNYSNLNVHKKICVDNPSPVFKKRKLDMGQEEAGEEEADRVIADTEEDTGDEDEVRIL
jgi:hypothetical protein